jgi:predicted amidohydrolase
LGGKPELAVVDIDPSIVDEVRTKLPVLANARQF